MRVPRSVEIDKCRKLHFAIFDHLPKSTANSPRYRKGQFSPNAQYPENDGGFFSISTLLGTLKIHILLDKMVLR